MSWCKGSKKCSTGYVCFACERCGYHCVCDPPSRAAVLSRKVDAADLASEVASQRLEIARLRAANARLRSIVEQYEKREVPA